MIASLMMYARPELEGAHNRLWACIRRSLLARGIDAPEALAQTAQEMSVWEDPALVLSQTCGMPYRTQLHDRVGLVGTPDYALEGCPAGHYHSVIVVREDDPREHLADFNAARLAYNSDNSQSGFAAFYTHTKASGFWFADRAESGSHLRSAFMVAGDEADIAALDAQSWRLIRRYEPVANRLRVLETTAPTPGLPLITGPSHDPQVVFDAVTEAFSQMSAGDMDLLDLRGLVQIPRSAYLAVPTPPAEAYA